MGRQESYVKLLNPTAHKRSSTNKLGLNRRVRSTMSAGQCLAQRVGRKIVTRSTSRSALLQMQQTILVAVSKDPSYPTSQFDSFPQRRENLHCPPKKPKNPADDSAPQIPRRHLSKSNHQQDFPEVDIEQSYQHKFNVPVSPHHNHTCATAEDTMCSNVTGSLSNQQNAVWDVPMPMDTSPRRAMLKYIRTGAWSAKNLRQKESISTQLCSLAANMSIQNSAAVTANSSLQSVGLPSDFDTQNRIGAEKYHMLQTQPSQVGNNKNFGSYGYISNDDRSNVLDNSLSDCRSDSSDARSTLSPKCPLSKRLQSSVSKATTSSVMSLEVRPGVWAQLRGAQETWTSIHQRDFYLPICCGTCFIELCCIRDVGHVLCPICCNVTSTEGVEKDELIRQDDFVGIGFTLDDLKVWEERETFKREATAA